MNRQEALDLLRSELHSWRERPWSALRDAVGQSHRFERTGASGTSYQGSILVGWDHHPDGAIRVIGTIDDGGWRAWMPLTDDFILRPDGTFAGEDGPRAE